MYNVKNTRLTTCRSKFTAFPPIWKFTAIKLWKFQCENLFCKLFWLTLFEKVSVLSNLCLFRRNNGCQGPKHFVTTSLHEIFNKLIPTLMESKQQVTRPFWTSTWGGGWANLHSTSDLVHLFRVNSRHTSSVSQRESFTCMAFIMGLTMAIICKVMAFVCFTLSRRILRLQLVLW